MQEGEGSAGKWGLVDGWELPSWAVLEIEQLREDCAKHYNLRRVAEEERHKAVRLADDRGKVLANLDLQFRVLSRRLERMERTLESAEQSLLWHWEDLA